MNTNFVHIIKRIVDEQGESILANPQMLKGFVADYAKAESKTERLAFGRCIEQGYYRVLKQTTSPQERARIKPQIARQMSSIIKLELPLCTEAIDVLEAVIYGIPQTVSQPQYQRPPVYQHQQNSRQQTRQSAAARQMPAASTPQYQQQSHRQPYTPPGASVPAKKHTLRNVCIAAGILVAAAALIMIAAPGMITAVAPDANIPISRWQGYKDFDSFSLAVNFNEFLGESFSEEIFLAFIAAVSMASVVYKDIQFDVVSGEKLTKRYGVPLSLRREYNYLVEQDGSKIACSYAAAWVVLSSK
jgi:hypothetical protein